MEDKIYENNDPWIVITEEKIVILGSTYFVKNIVSVGIEKVENNKFLKIIFVLIFLFASSFLLDIFISSLETRNTIALPLILFIIWSVYDIVTDSDKYSVQIKDNTGDIKKIYTSDNLKLIRDIRESITIAVTNKNSSKSVFSGDISINDVNNSNVIIGDTTGNIKNGQ